MRKSIIAAAFVFVAFSAVPALASGVCVSGKPFTTSSDREMGFVCKDECGVAYYEMTVSGQRTDLAPVNRACKAKAKAKTR